MIENKPWMSKLIACFSPLDRDNDSAPYIPHWTGGGTSLISSAGSTAGVVDFGAMGTERVAFFSFDDAFMVTDFDEEAALAFRVLERKP